MRTILYLRSNEKELFEKLPAAVQAAWSDKIVEETLESFESQETLEKNLDNVPFASDPGYQAWVEKHASDMGSGAALADFPEDLLPAFFENIGACGLCAIIELALQNGTVDDKTMEAVSALSVLRHQVLTKNSVTV